MNENHVSEMAIQQYSFDKAACDISILDHIENCDRCKAEAKSYSIIIDEIKMSATPVFEFDLSALVFPELPPNKSKTRISWLRFLPYIICTVLAGLLFMVFYIGQPSTNISLGNVSPVIHYLIIVVAMSVAMYEGIDMYKRFRGKVERLDVY